MERNLGAFDSPAILSVSGTIGAAADSQRGIAVLLAGQRRCCSRFAATQLFTFRPQEQADRTLTSLLADEWRLHLRRTHPSRRRIVPPSKVSMGNIVSPDPGWQVEPSRRPVFEATNRSSVCDCSQRRDHHQAMADDHLHHFTI
jgi:hypothetical protein